MNKKYYWLIGLFAIIAVLLVSGCIIKEPDTEPKSIQVIYFIGSGWTGWQETLTINNDGSVILEEQQPLSDENKTTKTIQLSDEELKALKALIIDVNVFSFKDRYACDANCPTDAPGSSITFIIDGRQKDVSMHVAQDMPESLKQILEKIKSIEEKFNKFLENGFLEGKVTIGPICPVARNPPDPDCLPTEETYKSWPIEIWTSDKIRKVAQIEPILDGTYKIELSVGIYIVDLEEQQSSKVAEVGGSVLWGQSHDPVSNNFPATIYINSGLTTTLNIDIDTGIR